jgi:DnaD/phage-associated family protein
MSRLTIYKDNTAGSTVVSNQFIDEYMKDANDAQIKIYLYLLRMINANLPTSISDIADKFNHTEKDVLRALRYWEKQNLVTLEFDEKKELCGLHLNPMRQEAAVPAAPVTDAQAADVVAFPQNTDSQAAPVMIPQKTPAQDAAPESRAEGKTRTGRATAAAKQPPVKPSYSLDEVASMKKDEDFSQILFIAESYLGRTLSVPDIKSLLYIYRELHFSTELMDYLIEYCVGRDKREMRYIEKVAVNWAEENVVTVRQAKLRATRYDKLVYTVMKALGRQSDPTEQEAAFIRRWNKQYGFSADLILAACEKTVIAADSHRFEYAEGILSKWYKAGIRNLQDVKAAEEDFQKKKSAAATAPATAAKPRSSFHDFQQRDYDFDELEKELISN